MCDLFFPTLFSKRHSQVFFPPFITANYNGNDEFRPQFSSLEPHPGLPIRFPRVTHLSCLSLHTATITSRFPKTAITITADRNVNSTTFSTEPKPSLELKDTQRHTHTEWKEPLRKNDLFPIHLREENFNIGRRQCGETGTLVRCWWKCQLV